MRYRGSITIPAGTTEADPETVSLELNYGWIEEVEILFPPGHAGLTHLEIYYQESIIFPTNYDNPFVGDDTLLTIQDHYPVDADPFTVELRGWAPDATLDHTIYVAITVSRPEVPQGVFETAVALPG
jgi:hypothetical protein